MGGLSTVVVNASNSYALEVRYRRERMFCTSESEGVSEIRNTRRKSRVRVAGIFWFGFSLLIPTTEDGMCKMPTNSVKESGH